MKRPVIAMTMARESSKTDALAGAGELRKGFLT
jgi:hypothetical protein